MSNDDSPIDLLKEGVRIASFETCDSCEMHYLSDPEEEDCVLADHVEAYEWIIKARQFLDA